jgi:hypothetical protein
MTQVARMLQLFKRTFSPAASSLDVASSSLASSSSLQSSASTRELSTVTTSSESRARFASAIFGRNELSREISDEAGGAVVRSLLVLELDDGSNVSTVPIEELFEVIILAMA